MDPKVQEFWSGSVGWRVSLLSPPSSHPQLIISDVRSGVKSGHRIRHNCATLQKKGKKNCNSYNIKKKSNDDKNYWMMRRRLTSWICSPSITSTIAYVLFISFILYSSHWARCSVLFSADLVPADWLRPHWSQLSSSAGAKQEWTFPWLDFQPVFPFAQIALIPLSLPLPYLPPRPLPLPVLLSTPSLHSTNVL